MTRQRDEMEELQEMASDDRFRGFVQAVLQSSGCATVRTLFQRHPDIAFELHEEMCLLRGDVEEVGDFEHDMEREVM